eukprot:515376_1
MSLFFAINVLFIYNTHSAFVTTSGTNFMLNGKPYRFAGTNCYYLIYQDQFMVDNVIETAAAQGFEVIRTWAFIDIGYQNGSNSADSNGPIKNGIYFQYYDPETKAPTYNDTNLKMLDYVLYKAKQLGIKIILTVTNNWSDFGGIDQYNIWRQISDPNVKLYHDSFYNDTIIMGWYQAYVKHLITRVNTYSKSTYADDDTIFAWELANEPRCQGSGKFSSSNSCTKNYAVYMVQPWAWKITAWVDAMSTYIKSIDKNHMISTGDEGFYCEIYQKCPHVWCDCYYGISTRNNTKLKNIDFMSMHLYPDQWGQQNNWGNVWIANHTDIAKEIGKPALLGEYGAKNDQHNVYQQWTNTIYTNGTGGDLFWMISGRDDEPQHPYWVPDYDGYAVYCPNSTEPKPPGDIQSCPVLHAHAVQMEKNNLYIN